ncbi:hypothetical protein KCP69_17480 [Salmonella enterica subsp. enterica]|nr:hypothetical protein KCP69_17480 [Salmonella enterica subsp. enterica]
MEDALREETHLLVTPKASLAAFPARMLGRRELHRYDAVRASRDHFRRSPDTA